MRCYDSATTSHKTDQRCNRDRNQTVSTNGKTINCCWQHGGETNQTEARHKMIQTTSKNIK